MTTPFPRLAGRRDAQATRERLLVAALELFTTVGFRATTTPMLAAQAGVAEGTIYRHFSGKDALLNTAFARVQAWALGVMTAPDAAGIARAPERLGLIGRALAEEAARTPAVVRMFLQRSDERYLDDASRSAATAVRAALELTIASGKSDGLVRSGPAELWAGVWLALAGFAALRVAAGEWGPDHPQVALTLEAAWDAITA